MNICEKLRQSATVWRVTYPSEGWTHLGDCLRAERNGRPVVRIAHEAGISHTTIESYESGRKRYARPPDKMWRLVGFYRWTPDSLRRVLLGGLPDRLPADPAPPFVSPALYAELLAAISSHDGLSRNEKRRLLAGLHGGSTEREPDAPLRFVRSDERLR